MGLLMFKNITITRDDLPTLVNLCLEEGILRNWSSGNTEEAVEYHVDRILDNPSNENHYSNGGSIELKLFNEGTTFTLWNAVGSKPGDEFLDKVENAVQ